MLWRTQGFKLATGRIRRGSISAWLAGLCDSNNVVKCPTWVIYGGKKGLTYLAGARVHLHCPPALVLSFKRDIIPVQSPLPAPAHLIVNSLITINRL